MFFINQEEKMIGVTRGDAFWLGITMSDAENRPKHFLPGDVIRMKVFERKNCSAVVLQKEITVAEETDMAQIYISGKDTKIGAIINKPKDYWYEVEVNPDTDPRTIIGFDENEEKIFRLYPEGADREQEG